MYVIFGAHSEKKPKGRAEFVFNRAIELFGAVKFRAEFGGWDLSNSHCLEVLEAWPKIVNAVSSSASTSSASTNDNLIRVFMEKATPVAAILLKVARSLKSQKRLTKATMKPLLASLVNKWRALFPKKGIFTKFHHLEYHLLDFLDNWEMYGRLSEEGFENIHPLINSIREVVRTMSSHCQRYQTIHNRFQMQRRDDVGEVLAVVDSKTRGKKRPRGHTTNRRDVAVEIVSELGGIVENEGERFIILTDESRLPAKWSDEYMMCSRGKAPDSWVEVFKTSDDLDAVKKEEAKYSGR